MITFNQLPHRQKQRYVQHLIVKCKAKAHSPDYMVRVLNMLLDMPYKYVPHELKISIASTLMNYHLKLALVEITEVLRPSAKVYNSADYKTNWLNAIT